VSPRRALFEVADYDLGATLTSGQTFRWVLHNGSWEGILSSHWVRLTSIGNGIEAETAADVSSWDWLAHYLQIALDLRDITGQFPADEPMRAAVTCCYGLRLLRQDPWECLASFILSSTKQIVQIQQIVALLCARFGEPVVVPPDRPPAGRFPSAERLAQASEAELRACKMGFRAPYLLGTARAVAAGELSLPALANLTTEQARAELLKLPGVGRKIADCILLFAYGFQDAFPVDVWVSKALRELYFRNRRIPHKRLQHFSQTHFGPYAGYAQQYLFHYMRTRPARKSEKTPVVRNVPGQRRSGTVRRHIHPQAQPPT
jgi:N-glycosylase/DNA lyase